MGITDYIKEKTGLTTYAEGAYASFNDGSVEVETAELLYAFTRMLKPEYILDLGTYKGVSAAYMGLACKENQKGVVHTVEFDSQHWDGAEKLWSTLAISTYVTQWKRKADEIIVPLGVMYDLILIDTEPATRFAELIQFYPYLNPGGYVFIHDLPRHLSQEKHSNPDHPDEPYWPYGRLPDQIHNWLKDRELVPFYFNNPRGLTGLCKSDSRDYKIL